MIENQFRLFKQIQVLQEWGVHANYQVLFDIYLIFLLPFFH